MEGGGQGGHASPRKDGGGGILAGTFLFGVRRPSDLEGDVTTHSPLTYLCLGLEIRFWDAFHYQAGCTLHKRAQPKRD